MRVVLDTNVLVSAVFFGGTPGQVLSHWRDGAFEIVVSREVLEESSALASGLRCGHPVLTLVLRWT